MTHPQFLEVALSLSIQVALLVLSAFGLARLANRDTIASRIWAGCHLLILALTLRAFLLPRLRPLDLFPTWEPGLAREIVLLAGRLGQAALLLWMIGAAYSFVMFLVRWFQVHRFLKSCRPLPKETWDTVFCLEPRQQSFATGQPEFLTSDRLLSPFCWQFHRPFIVLPEFLLDFEQEQLRLIVRHELAHLRTGHPLMLFVQRIVEIAYWFHPVVWWSSRQAALSREFACDEAAVHSRVDVANYLRSLLKIVERVEEESDSKSIDLAFGRNKGIIARRASRLVSLAKQQRGVWPAQPIRERLPVLLAAVALWIAVFVWTPLDPKGSPPARWSPWPTWSAKALHAFGFSFRDYDVNDFRFRNHELLEDQPESSDSPVPSL